MKKYDVPGIEGLRNWLTQQIVRVTGLPQATIAGQMSRRKLLRAGASSAVTSASSSATLSGSGPSTASTSSAAASALDPVLSGQGLGQDLPPGLSAIARNRT